MSSYGRRREKLRRAAASSSKSEPNSSNQAAREVPFSVAGGELRGDEDAVS